MTIVNKPGFQKLIYPVNKMRITASINTEAYYKKFLFRHFGTDVVSTSFNNRVFASGNGRVVNTGYDRNCGNIIVIKYENAYNHKNKSIESIVIRYFHLERKSVKINDIVTKDTVIGYYGKTGKYGGTGAHLHMEADVDTKFSLYTPTVKKSDYLKGTQDGAYPYNSSKNTVRNIMNYLHCKTEKPDYQKLVNTTSKFVSKEDLQVIKY